MKTVTASEMKNKLASVFEKASSCPVHISRRGTEGYVLLSANEYERLDALEDMYWSSVAKKARQNGEYLSTKKSIQEIEKRLT